jgi:hypothetical protein
MYSWLEKLHSENPGQFAALLQGGVELTTLDPEGQLLLGGNWSGVPHAMAGIAQGIPVSVCLGMFPRLLRNGRDVSSELTAGAATLSSQALKKNSVAPAPQNTAPFIPQSEGELDFQQGSILTMVELANKACDQFSFGYGMDYRVGTSPLFVKGKFTKERIMAALKALGAGPTLVVKPSLTDDQLYSLKRRVLTECLSVHANPNDPKAAYLQRVLDNPAGSIDPTALSLFNNDSRASDQATSVSLALFISLTSNIYDHEFEDGSHKMVPTTFTEVINGT